MAKKSKKHQNAKKEKRDLSHEGPLFSKGGKILMAVGAVLVVLGFYLVTLTDPAGRNWASHLCPFVILGGYALVGVGLVFPDSSSDRSSLSS